MDNTHDTAAVFVRDYYADTRDTGRVYGEAWMRQETGLFILLMKFSK